MLSPTRWVTYIVGSLLSTMLMHAVRAEALDKKYQTIEMHFLICPDSIDQVLDAFSLEVAAEEPRTVYYFDTDDRRHFRAGLIIKATQKPDKTRLDLKRRPLDPSQVSSTWAETDGFQCEFDRYIDREGFSCTLRDQRGDQRLAEVLAGQATVEELFPHSATEPFLTHFYENEFVWSELQPVASVDVQKWQTEIRNLDLDVEVWTLNNSRVIYEVSHRSNNQGSARSAQRRILALLARKQLALCPAQESKTAQVMRQL